MPGRSLTSPVQGEAILHFERIHLREVGIAQLINSFI